jgi:hypothetical protein
MVYIMFNLISITILNEHTSISDFRHQIYPSHPDRVLMAWFNSALACSVDIVVTLSESAIEA